MNTPVHRRSRLTSTVMLGVALSLAGCATPTPYQPAAGTGTGYSEQKLAEDRYRVSFAGNEATSRRTVETYLLYRAAELTLENGHGHFVVTERSTEKEVDLEPSWAPFYGHYPYAAVGLGHPQFPYYAHGPPWGYDIPSRVDVEYEAVAYITLGDDDADLDDRAAYDAREVLRHLGSEIERS